MMYNNTYIIYVLAILYWGSLYFASKTLLKDIVKERGVDFIPNFITLFQVVLWPLSLLMYIVCLPVIFGINSLQLANEATKEESDGAI